MSFNKRLIYYLFGFTIGCFITYFIINQKNTEFNYLPNQRVLNDLKKKKWSFDESFMNIDTIKILDKSKIIFSESEVNIDSCNIYKVKKEKNSQYFFNVKNCSEVVYFYDLRSSSD